MSNPAKPMRTAGWESTKAKVVVLEICHDVSCFSGRCPWRDLESASPKISFSIHRL